MNPCEGISLLLQTRVVTEAEPVHLTPTPESGSIITRHTVQIYDLARRLYGLYKPASHIEGVSIGPPLTTLVLHST